MILEEGKIILRELRCCSEQKILCGMFIFLFNRNHMTYEVGGESSGHEQGQESLLTYHMNHFQAHNVYGVTRNYKINSIVHMLEHLNLIIITFW